MENIKTFEKIKQAFLNEIIETRAEVVKEIEVVEKQLSELFEKLNETPREVFAELQLDRDELEIQLAALDKEYQSVLLTTYQDFEVTLTTIMESNFDEVDADADADALRFHVKH